MVLIVAMGDGFKVGSATGSGSSEKRSHRVWGAHEKQAGGRRAGRRIRLDYDDVRDIRAECFLVRYVIADFRIR